MRHPWFNNSTPWPGTVKSICMVFCLLCKILNLNWPLKSPKLCLSCKRCLMFKQLRIYQLFSSCMAVKASIANILSPWTCSNKVTKFTSPPKWWLCGLELKSLASSCPYSMTTSATTGTTKTSINPCMRCKRKVNQNLKAPRNNSLNWEYQATTLEMMRHLSKMKTYEA